MSLKRPNLKNLAPQVRAYIEYLETELERLQSTQTTPHSVQQTRQKTDKPTEDVNIPKEPPTTINVITATKSGLAKRTPRHLYTTQRRGGMGIFDLASPDDQPPAILSLADQSQSLLLLTDQARAFRLPANAIPETPVRGKGQSITVKLGFASGENLAVITPIQAQGYLALISQSGAVRLLRHHVFGEYMKPGTSLYDFQKFGPLSSACWTPGDSDLFIATSSGRAIRFSEKLVPPRGAQGIRLTPGDQAVSITAIFPYSSVFILGADGKGTVRLMSGFSPNKAPGAGGKTAFKTDRLITALNVDEQQDLFVVTQLGKIIRFRVDEVPPKDGVVQGVTCISLRNDEPVAAAINPSPNTL
jgi:DNA gyrase subunit A